jgi:Cu(I)/Ag(I) efflux system membrane fusion protein
VNFTPAARQEVLVVPSEAVIQTGRRSVVVVARPDGRFAPVEVQTGTEANGKTEIRKGLEAGEKVVVSGQFLIDSEASLRAGEARMGDAPAAAEALAPGHKGAGKVVSVDAAGGHVELDHEAIPSLQWPRMTMGFMVENKAQLAKLKKGDAVEFELRAKPDADGSYVISRIGGKP